MELLYLYINEPERKQKDLGICFTDRYKISFQNGKLSITEPDPEQAANHIRIFDKNIVSISALVGENGVGKTTILNTIGYGRYNNENINSDDKWFAVYEIESDDSRPHFYIEGKDADILPYEISKQIEWRKGNYSFEIAAYKNENRVELLPDTLDESYKCQKLGLIYYSHMSETPKNEPVYPKRIFMSSDNSLKITLEKYYDILNRAADSKFGQAMKSNPDHIRYDVCLPYAYHLKEDDGTQQKRLAKLIYGQKPDGPYIHNVRWAENENDPKNVLYSFIINILHELLYSLLYTNWKEYNASNLKEIQKITDSIRAEYQEKSLKDQAEFLFRVYFGILQWSEKNKFNNDIYRRHMLLSGECLNLLCVLDYEYAEAVYPEIPDKYQIYFKQALDRQPDKNVSILNVADQKYLTFDGETIRFTIKGMNKSQKDYMLTLAGELDNLTSACKRYEINLIKHSIPGVSAGEQKFVHLFAAVQHGCEELLHNFRDWNGEKLILLLIDEPDANLHPEWSRRLIDILNEDIHRHMLGTDAKVQVILSTHSPIMLSDIPGNNVWRMKKVNDQVVIGRSQSTFASNIFDIMKNDFFIEQYLGEFAYNYINELYDDLMKMEENSLRKIDAGELAMLKKRADLIGEEMIRQNIRLRIRRLEESFYTKKIAGVLNSENLTAEEIVTKIRSIINDQA